MNYDPWGCKELDMTELLSTRACTNTHIHIYIYFSSDSFAFKVITKY